MVRSCRWRGNKKQHKIRASEKENHITLENMGKDKWEIENIVLNPIAGATLTQPQTIISPGGHC